MEKEELKQRCLDAIDANRDLIIQLGDDVYKTPELGYKEFKTTERMIKAFQEIGEDVPKHPAHQPDVHHKAAVNVV